MRYAIFDPAIGYIVKDTKRGEQCHYSKSGVASALRDGIGKSEYEATRREVLVPIPEVQLREHVRILREALIDLLDGYKSQRDHGGGIPMGILNDCEAALNATKEEE